jgi:hypothetical protein
LTDIFFKWFEALEQRHLKNLTFAEVRKGVQALSTLYVHRRERIGRSSGLNGAGKRAAFAMYFGPLHFLLVREIVRALDARLPPGTTVVDLGCGTGAAGAAWALHTQPASKVIGIDRHPWNLEECQWTYSELGIPGVTRAADIGSVYIPQRAAIIAAFAINELDVPIRQRFLKMFLAHAQRDVPVLVIEPIARRVASWWDEWARDWKKTGGREDEWRFRVELPDKLALMDKAAGLDHRELTGRSLWLPGGVIE